MIVKTGCVVSHSVATEWGVGKVLDINEIKATIQFNDGIIRRITSSHFTDLQLADPASYIPPSVSHGLKAKSAGAKKTRK